MGDEDLIVAVRLCDVSVSEKEQPDPLCLRREDLGTWRHFESLLRGMYKIPPDAIIVKYLDDENDWVHVGSDAELSEAVRIAKEAGDILQLQVNRLDTEQLINFDNTESSNANENRSASFAYDVPTKGPRTSDLKPLVYPYHTIDQSSAVDGPTASSMAPQNATQLIVYPHHTEKKELPLVNEGENQTSLQKLAPFQSSGGHMGPKEVTNPGLDVDKTHSQWGDAAGLSTEEKLKFMKGLLGWNNQKTDAQFTNTESGQKPDSSRCVTNEKAEPIVAPLCSEPSSLGKNFVPNQDPFEVDSVSQSLFEHVMINFEKDRSPTLTPKRTITNNNEPSAKFFRTSSVETDGAASVSGFDTCQSKLLMDLLVPAHHGQSAPQPRAGYTSALPSSKLLKRVPVPMPRNLLMMEGAQSGANAVAIEIPSESSDFFQGAAVNKEEEIAASGGAASTSASEETGELMARADSVASGISREVKVANPLSESCAVSGDGGRHKSEKKAKRSSSKVKHSSSKKEKSAEKKYDAGTDGVKQKSSEKSEKKHSDIKKTSEDSNPKESRKDEKKVKVTEDVESGEKVNMKREVTTLSRCEFAKYMKRTKKELHASIVKDVARLTENYFSKVVEKTSLESLLNDIFGIREPAYHEGVYCDGCNREIYGIRYKCGNCLDFDLCSICENRPHMHDSTHVFLKLRNPARKAGKRDGENFLLVVENIYEAESLKMPLMEHPKNTSKDNMERELCENRDPTVLAATSQTVQDLTHQLVAENTPSSRSEDLDLSCVSSEKQAGTTSDLQNSKVIPKQLPLTKLYPSTPVRSDSIAEGAHCNEQSPTPSDSSSSVVPVSPPVMTSPFEFGKLTEETKCSFWNNFQNMPEFQAAVYSLDDADDLPELISNGTVKSSKSEKFGDDNDDDEEDHGNSSSFEDMDSDTSDDFCVIEPPESHIDRDGYETLEGDVEEHVQSQVEVTNAAIQSEATQASAEEEAKEETNDIEAGEKTENNTTSSGVLDEAVVEQINMEDTVEEIKEVKENKKKEEAVVLECKKDDEVKEAETHSFDAADGVSIDGLVHTMSDEEKIRFAQLLRAEMDKEYECELKRRAYELEKELKLQKEKEFQLILEAKEKAAAFENEKLEWVAKKKEEEVRILGITRQMSDASISSSGGPASEDGAYGGKKDADCQTSPEPLSPASHIIQNVASGVSKAAATAFYTAKDVFYSLQAKQTEWKNASYSCKPPQPEIRLARMSSQISTDGDLCKSGDSSLQPTKPAEINTMSDSEQPNVSVEKVKTPTSPTEFYECSESVIRPVRDSQEAENAKPVRIPRPLPLSCWAPQKSTFKLPTSTWTPPKDDYIPPTSTWTPQKHEFIPPNIEWITAARPGKTLGSVVDVEKCKERRGSESDTTTSALEQQMESSRRPSITSPSQKTTPFAPLEIADTALRRELLGMQRLIEMGFANREKNRQLLNKFDNDLEKVVQSLLQEEGETEDSHWAFHRH